MNHDRTYAEVLHDIVKTGYTTENRTGVNTVTTFGQEMRFDLREAFPLLTGKSIHWKSVVEELLWFMRGDTNVRSLQEKGVSIWDEWADERGYLGPVYGAQWRRWEVYKPDCPCDGTYNHIEIDQLAEALEKIRNHPRDRRIIVSAWNPGDLDEMALPPCHLLFQFHVRPDGFLDCKMYQRSCDFFLGVPFNIASYSLLTHIMAHMAGLHAGTFIWSGGDCHIYVNHMLQVHEYLHRAFLRESPPSPTLKLEPGGHRTLDNWQFDDFDLIEYNPLPAIPAPVAV